MNPTERSIVSAAVADACCAMLLAGDRSLEMPSDGDPSSDLPGTLPGKLIVSIGFGHGDQLRGRLMLIAQPDAYRRFYPPGMMASSLSSRILADWASEMANQMLGRIKSRLGAHGLDFSMGLPLVVAGSELRLPTPGADAVGHSMRIGRHRFDAILEIEQPAGRNLFSEGQPTIGLPDGAVVFFED